MDGVFGPLPDVLWCGFGSPTLIWKTGLALVHCVARIGVVLSALRIEAGDRASAIAWAAASAVAYVGVRIGSSLLRARREIPLSLEVLHRVLRSDLFLEPPRLQQDVLIGGLYELTRIEVVVLPAVYGDVLAALAVCGIAASRGEGVRLGAFLVGLACGLGGVVAARRTVWRASGRAWTTRQAHTQRVLDGLEGVQEIVGWAAVDAFEARVAAGLRELRRASWVVAAESLVIGRAPILAGIALALVVASMFGGVVPTRATEWAVLAAMLPPFAGIIASIAAIAEARAPTQAVRDVLRRPLRSDGHVVPGDIVPIALRDVTVIYAAPALDSVSVEVAEGLTVFAGPNGSGKSTVLRLMAGLVTPQDGDVIVGDTNGRTLQWDAFRKRIAYLPQRPYLPVGASVREALEFVRKSDAARSRAALERLDIWRVLAAKTPADALATTVDELSVGERQRVALARVLAFDAEIYLLDEPDANLDRAGIERLCNILRDLAKRATVIVAAHTPEIVAVADQVIELDRGRVVQRASTRGQSGVMGA